MNHFINKLIYPLLAVLLLNACSSSSGGSSSSNGEEPNNTLVNPTTGIIVDSAVAGIDYVCSSGNTGVTNTLGEFTCEVGDTVTLTLAGISLGEVSVDDYTLPNYLTPLALFNGDEEAATNFAQLIQTLDSDGDLSNGIDINSTLALALGTDINFFSPDFDSLLQTLLGDDANLTSEDDAKKHLDETFASLNINDDGTSPRDPDYAWLAQEWGSCTGPCGTANGTATREVICQEDANATVDDSLCTQEKPALTESCTASVCSTPGVVSQSPTFTSDANQSIAERNSEGPEGTYSFTLVATDPQSDTITYSISGGDFADFSVNANNGLVTFNNNMLPDFEIKRTYLFTAKATDTNNNFVTQDVNISITDEVDIALNGKGYGSVVSSFTGELWLDRNLGATQVCTVFDDMQCYGDYYQWGRNADGHQLSTSISVDVNNTAVADVTNVGHGNFLESNSTYSNDWTRGTDAPDGTTRIAEWSKTDGTSVCPEGFRVPTIAELEAETISEDVNNSATAFSSFLKLPSAGYRLDSSGLMSNEGTKGYVWSIDISGPHSNSLDFDSSSVSTGNNHRANGQSVRCLQDTTPPAM